MTNHIYSPLSSKTRPQMFFGDGHYVQEFLELDYPWALKSADRQNSQDWAFDEFNLKLDAQQLSSANNAVRHIFTTNLQSQIFADSIQGRGPSWLIPYITDPSLEYAFTQWARFECVTGEHEVLTAKGWLRIDQLEEDTAVAQMDVNTNEVSFVVPSRIVKTKTDKLIKFEGENISQYVTPNHRIPIINRNYRAEFISPYDVDTTTDQQFLITSGFSSEGINLGLTELELLLLIKTLHPSLVIDESRTDEFNDLLVNCGIKFNTTWKEGQILNYIMFNTEILDSVDTSSFSGWIDISTKSQTWCIDFIEHIVRWNPTLNMSRVNADIVQALAHICGSSIIFKYNEDETVTLIIDENITAYSASTLTKIEEDVENLDVYCLTVPTGAFMLRHNDKVSVTGNCLHSRSYTHILTSMYPNPKIVLDMIEQKPEILARFSIAVEQYNIFFENPTKRNLVLLIAAINILEGLSFYSSFICNFSFAKQGMFESVSKYLQLIARDEALHLGITQQIIKAWSSGKDGPEWKALWEECKPEVRNMYVRGIEQEFEFSKYLFKYGTPIVGLNEEILNQCNIYYGNKRMRTIGLKPYNNLNKDPLPWVQSKYLSSSAVQDAPQEVSLNTYLKDSVIPLQDPTAISSLFDKVSKKYAIPI